MGITFKEIDTTDLTPRAKMEFDTSSAIHNLPDGAQKVLLVGQQLAGAAQPVNTPLENFRATDASDAHGAGTPLDLAARAAYAANPEVDLWTMGVADAAGAAAATLAITYATDAAKNGAGRIRSCGIEVTWDITAADTPTDVAANGVAAVNGQPQFPFTAANVLGVLTLTAKSKGPVGNGINVLADVEGDGIGTTCTPAGTGVGGYYPLTGGTTNPTTIATALAAIDGVRFDKIVMLFDDATSGAAADAHVDPEDQAEEGFGEVATQAVNGSLSTATTLATGINSAYHVVLGIRGCPSWHVMINAAFAAVVAASQQNQPNLPCNKLVLAGIEPPPVTSRWIRSETKALLANGVTPLAVNASEQVCIVRDVTTRVKDDDGNPNLSELDLGTVQALFFMRDSYDLMFETLYPRALWADDDADGLLPDSVATPAKVRINLIQVAHQLEAKGIIQDVDANADMFEVEKSNDEALYQVPANIIPGLQRAFGKAVLIQGSLPVGGQ